MRRRYCPARRGQNELPDSSGRNLQRVWCVGARPLGDTRVQIRNGGQQIDLDCGEEFVPTRRRPQGSADF